MITTCKSCGARIVWAVTERGSRMPFDATGDTGPELKGKFFLVDGRAFSTASIAVEAARSAALNAPRYTSHFATCAHAAQHRKAR